LIEGMAWEVRNLYHEWAGGKSSEGRETNHEVVLGRRRRLALTKLNPHISTSAFDQAIDELTRDRSKLVPVNANEEFYRLLKEGVPVKVPNEHGTDIIERVRFIDWRTPENNDFLLAS